MESIFQKLVLDNVGDYIKWERLDGGGLKRHGKCCGGYIEGNCLYAATLCKTKDTEGCNMQWESVG